MFGKKILALAAASIMAVTSLTATVSADEWVKTDKGYVYTYDNGSKAASGWLKIGDDIYYIKADGTRKTGWLSTKSGDKYYLNQDGLLQTNKWLTLNDGTKYYLKSNGKVAKSCTLTIGSAKYSFNENGEIIYDSSKISLNMSLSSFKKALNTDILSEDDGFYLDMSCISNLDTWVIYNFDNDKLNLYGYAFDDTNDNYAALKKYFTTDIGKKPTYSGSNGCYWDMKSKGYFTIFSSDDILYAVYTDSPCIEKESTTTTTSSTSSSQSKTVYVTKTGKRYHYSSSCNGGTYYASTLSDAQARGLTPCNKCVN